jgi:hypothetical protein
MTKSVHSEVNLCLKKCKIDGFTAGALYINKLTNSNSLELV